MFYNKKHLLIFIGIEILALAVFLANLPSKEGDVPYVLKIVVHILFWLLIVAVGYLICQAITVVLDTKKLVKIIVNCDVDLLNHFQDGHICLWPREDRHIFQSRVLYYRSLFYDFSEMQDILTSYKKEIDGLNTSAHKHNLIYFYYFAALIQSKLFLEDCNLKEVSSLLNQMEYFKDSLGKRVPQKPLFLWLEYQLKMRGQNRNLVWNLEETPVQFFRKEVTPFEKRQASLFKWLCKYCLAEALYYENAEENRQEIREILSEISENADSRLVVFRKTREWLEEEA